MGTAVYLASTTVMAALAELLERVLLLLALVLIPSWLEQVPLVLSKRLQPQVEIVRSPV